MKKLVSLVLIFALIMSFAITVNADDLFGDGGNTENSGAETITPDDYNGAQQEEPKQEEPKQEENKNQESGDTKLPQTGIEDTGLGILLIVCLGSIIYSYKKINGYKDI